MRRPADIGTVPAPEPDRDQAPAAVRVRLWPNEYRAIVGAAQRAGLPLKEWTVRVLIGAAK